MRKLAAVPALLFLGSLLWACGGASDGVETADIADILTSGPSVTDVTARSATVLATTNVDVVCAVVYGLTTDYGQIATDLDMAGGGHGDHGPMLLGLQPDTEYHYNLGGVGPDGTVYRGQDSTFRTLPLDESALPEPAGPNLALLSAGGSIAGHSSSFGGSDQGTWGPVRAIDGDPGTQWSSDGDGDDAWIEIELPSLTHVTSIGFWSRTMGSSAQVNSFQVVTDVGETHGPFSLEDAAGVHYFEVDFTARRLRFEATETSGGNTGAVEIEVYGEPGG